MIGNFIKILLLFLNLCVLTQNAPVSLVKRETSTPLSVKTQDFYCTSVLLKNLVKFMVRVKHSVALPSKHGNGTYSQGNVNLLLQQFDFTCTTFTNVMAIKHQLQYSLFNGSFYNEKNGSLVKVDNEELKNFTSILGYLQDLQTILQKIEEILTNNYCIEFSASQYEKIYWNLINGDEIVSVLNTLENVKWAIIGEYPHEWTKDPHKSPVHSNCTNHLNNH